MNTTIQIIAQPKWSLLMKMSITYIKVGVGNNNRDSNIEG